MKKLAEYDRILRDFENKFGLEIRSAKQGSERWLETRLGVITASKASSAVAEKSTDTRLTYLCELVSKVCTGVVEELDFKQLQWGKEHEDAARSSYEFSTGQHMRPLTFVFKDNKFRIGCSPDGVILDSMKPSEIKCPWSSTNYVKFLLEGVQKREWKWQNQFTMWVMGVDEMDITQYDPRMKAKPIHTITVKKDNDMRKKLEDTIPELILDMDKMLKEIGVKYGEQWTRLVKRGSNDAA